MFYVVVLLLYVFFFFFKQKTAYEMRISDWSSDVCSSDLDSRRGFAIGAESAIGQIEGSATMPFYEHVFIARQDLSQRSEERRVGKECVSTCRSRWSPYH